MNAQPDKEIERLRKEQREDREHVEAIEQRIKNRADRLDQLRRDAKLLDRLHKAAVRQPVTVMNAADRAADEANVDEAEFRAMALVILSKETGLPQKSIFGCDHGAQGGNPPFCHEEVTHERGLAFVRQLHATPMASMNGVHWTQTTWYEKVFRVEKLSPDLTDPAAHMEVCFGDLAILRKSYGVADAFRRYNGSGPAADAYSLDAMNRLPRFKDLVRG